MGKFIFLFAAGIFFLGIIKSKGANRLIWFFTGIIFFQDRIILWDTPPVISFHRFLVYVLIITELINLKRFIADFKSFPLKNSILFLLFGVWCIGFFDNRHGTLLNLYRSTDIFIQTFFVVFLGYRNFIKKSEWQKMVKFFLITSIILCFYGLYNYLTKSNPYDAFITAQFPGDSFFDQYFEDLNTRFRINSFVFHPIFYGYLLSILFLLSLYCFSFLKRNKNLCLLAITIIFINLILCNSRTPLFAFFIGLIVFITMAFQGIIKIKILMLGIVIGAAVYCIPVVNEKINNTIDVFETGGNKVEGSSVDMRMIQLLASYNEFLESPFFGNGFYYISENLGVTANPQESTSDSELQGLESHIYSLLIEQGVIGILTNVIFFFTIITYFLNRRSLNKQVAALGLSIILMFLIYIIGTGSMGTWIITMGITGIIIKYLEFSSSGELIRKHSVNSALDFRDIVKY